MVLAGATGAESIQGNLSALDVTRHWLALTASGALLLLLARRLRRAL